jgi:hypothetical protein
MLHISSCQQELVYSFWDFLELLQHVHGLKFHVTQGKVTESVCILDVTDGKTASHGTYFHNW